MKNTTKTSVVTTLFGTACFLGAIVIFASCGKNDSTAKDGAHKRGLLQRAQQGDVQAQFELGEFYEKGIGGAKEYSEALRWYGVAGTNGEKRAQFRLGVLHAAGLGTPKDYETAVVWFRKAAEQGVGEAQTILGESYLYGRGNDQSFSQAFEWFLKGANSGDPVSQMHAAVFYRGGHGVEANPKLVAHWFQNAANRWYLQAQYHLSLCYAEGFGVHQDIVEAYKWAFLSKTAGYPSATNLCIQLENVKGAKDPEIREAAKRANIFLKTNTFRPPSRPWPDIPLPEDSLVK